MMRKPKQKLEQKLIIPDNILEQLRGLKEGENDVVCEHLLMVMNETDVTKQTAYLKKAIDKLKKICVGDCVNNKAIKLCFNTMCYIFMDCESKNPCRRTITSFFQSLPMDSCDYVYEYINKLLLEMFKVTIEQVKKEDQDINLRKIVDTVCSLLENVDIGEKCISENIIQVLSFLAISLEYQIKKESLIGTPALQTVAMLDCLVSIKTIMSVIQKCNDKMKMIASDNELIALNQRFIIAVTTILKNETFFPDCRSAAGMAVSLLVRISTTTQQLLPITMLLFFPSYVDHDKLPENQTILSHWIFTCFNHSTLKDISGFSYLSICRGVMTMFDNTTLLVKLNFIKSDVQESHCGNLILDVLFPEISSLCFQLKDSNSLVAFRTLANWTLQLRNAVNSGLVEDCFKPRLQGTEAMAQKLLNIVWNYWDHPMEQMRYHTREIFDNVVKVHISVEATLNTGPDQFLENLLKKLCDVDWFVRGKYGPLCCLVDILGSSRILEFYPTLPHMIMGVMCDQTIVPHAMEFVEKMFIKHLEQLSGETEHYLRDWVNVWVNPCLQNLSSKDKNVRKHLTEYYIPKLLKCCPNSLSLMVETVQMDSQGDVTCLVTCLKTARHLGLLPRVELCDDKDDNNQGLWLQTLPMTLLQQSLCHLSDEIRCDVLALICDSVRTTEILTSKDLELLRKFYPENMNSQSPSFRQKVLGITKKLLIRLRDGGRSLKRKLSAGKNEAQMILETKQISLYTDFLDWFAHVQFSSLFPGSSFCRRTTALQNLNLLIQIFPMKFKNQDSFTIFQSDDVFTTNTVHISLDCLKDTYDINKAMAFTLLLSCPSQRHPFQDRSFTKQWTSVATQSAISPKAIDVSTAAYMLKLLIHKSPYTITLFGEDDINHCVQDSLRHMKIGECDMVHEQHYMVLCQLVKILQNQLQVAKKSLLQAAFSAPMHGVLYCMKEIICDLELSDVSEDKSWQQLVLSMIQCCYDVTEVVSPVVTNASPEGNVTIQDDQTEELVTDECEMFAPKAQILLVCCWRTMKEISLLLGEITQRAPVKETQGGHGLLSIIEFEAIGQLFTNILLTAKHRGAYELAHEGFLKLCYMLWRCEQQHLQCLPETFLHRLLSDICSDKPTPWLCGTRRSAGLPFFFKAIITTEPNTTGKSCFNAVMKELLATAKKPINILDLNEDTTMPQVHARNILRALYKETKLGEDVYPYVTEGVKMAVEGFLSESWAVRNSSTLLFSALMNRIFGPQNVQVEKRRQGMTGREFFSRFPSLHSFLVEQLETSLEAVESESASSIHLYPSLYPVLLLLSRLHPSAMDGNDSTLNMAAFIPYVMRCSKSYVFKTRTMAARALVPLVSGENSLEMLKTLIGSLPLDKSNVYQNHIHGCLLQIREILMGVSENMSFPQRTKESIFETITPLLVERKWLATNDNVCDITRAVFLNICRLFIFNQHWVTGTDQPLMFSTMLNHHIETLTQVIMKEPTTPSQNISIRIGGIFVDEEIARMVLQPISKKSQNGVLESGDVERILKLLTAEHYEVTLVTLEFLYEIFQNLKDQTSCELSSIVNVLLKQITRSTMKPSCLVQLHKCLSLSPSTTKFPWDSDNEQINHVNGWKQLLQSFNTNNQLPELKCSLLQFSSSLITQLYEIILSKSETLSQCLNILDEWVTYVEMYGSHDENETVRLTLSKILSSSHVSRLLTAPITIFGTIPFRLWRLIIHLLIDDSVDVKVSMATGLSNIVREVHHQGGCHTLHINMALRHAVQTPLAYYWQHSSNSCIAWLLSLMTECCYDNDDDSATTAAAAAYDDMASIDRLFEKGPSNTFYEACALAGIIHDTFIAHVQNLRARELSTETHLEFENFIKQQLEQYSETLPQNIKFSIIYKILVAIRMNDTILMTNQASIEESMFFKEIRIWLRKLRTNNCDTCFYHFKLKELSDLILGAD